MAELGMTGGEMFAYEMTYGSNLDLSDPCTDKDGCILSLENDIYPEYDIILCISTYSATAPLTAINAAVAGVVLSLAIAFAGTVFFPDGETLNLFGLAITGVAAFALFRLKRTILEVIAGGVVVGFVIGLVATFSG